MKSLRMKLRVLLAVLAMICTAVAAEPRQEKKDEVDKDDPTVPADAMADALKQQLRGAEGLRLHALVVGAGEEGVALVGYAVPTAVAVRRGSVVVQTVAGVKVDVTIKKVTPLGVELETSDADKSVFIPGSFAPGPKKENPGPEFISYLECEKVPLGQLMRLVADQTGVNISATDQTVGKPVSILLRNVTAGDAVEEVCRATGLWYRREPTSNVIRITTMSEFESNLNTFREESTQVFTLLYPNVVEVASVIYGLYPDRTLLSLGEDEFDKDAEYDIARRLNRFRLISNNGNASFMGMRAPITSTTSYGNSGNFSFTRGNLISRISQWDALLNRSRRGASGRSSISSDEAEFIEDAQSVGDTNLVDLAIQKSALGSANIFITISRRNNKLIVRTSDVKAMDEIHRIISEMDVPTPMVLLEVKVLELDITDSYNAGIKWSVFDPDGVENALRIGTGENLAAKAMSLAGSQAAFNPTFTFTVLSDHVKSQIEMMQKDGKVKTLATPTLLTANDEVARIFSGKNYPLVAGWTKGETVTTLSGYTTSQATVNIEKKDVGTMLLITPNINADKTVTLRLLQEDSEVSADKVEIPISGGDGWTKPIEYVNSRSLTGTFIAKDNMTVMAGGLVRERQENTYWRIPVLGSVPLLGWLFRGTDKELHRTELVILIRPHVILTSLEGGKISDEVTRALSMHPAADGRDNIGVFAEKDDDESNELKTHDVSDDVRNVVK